MSIEPQKVDYSSYYIGSNKKERKKRGKRETKDTAFSFSYIEKDVKNSKKHKKNSHAKKFKRGNKKINVNITRQGKFTLAVVILTVLIVSSLGFCFENAEKLKSKKNSDNFIYCLESVALPTEGQAKYIADKVKISGGAGYIAKTEQGYCVAIETYDNIKKAKNVLKELNGRYCQLRIRKFKIITPIISSYDEQTSVLFKDAFDCFSEVYLSLHILAERIQNGEIEKEKAIKTVREIKAEVIDRRDYFKENVAISYQDINYVRMLASFSALISALDEITTSKNASPNLLCDIRNCYIKILNIHNMLIYEAGNVIN